MVAEDDEMSKEKEIDKLMALISLSFKKIYKPTNNNLRTSSNTSRTHQDNTPRINRGIGYDNQRVVNVVGARENVSSLEDIPRLDTSKSNTYTLKNTSFKKRTTIKPKVSNVRHTYHLCAALAFKSKTVKIVTPSNL
ncbi:hypothetical protein Tco_0677081, partial [Tanacetum coccineum]